MREPWFPHTGICPSNEPEAECEALLDIINSSTSKQGKYDLARELMHKAAEPFQFFALPMRNARAFLRQTYAWGCIELTTGECDRAESCFTATIEACDMQSELMRKACSIRGLGEIAFARSDFVLARQEFEETRSLRVEMGVPSQRLYSCLPFNSLPDKFKGWTALFLKGLTPLANDPRLPTLVGECRTQFFSHASVGLRSFLPRSPCQNILFVYSTFCTSPQNDATRFKLWLRSLSVLWAAH
ncbi:hypothetical protein P692DRAFT_20870398 [Suillus brevipes Sb2]|nr:hypothetical protein P692DRAFT_20870398 [Suillus brevipes Sb2]